MGEVIPFRKPRKGTIRGAARSCLTEALNSVKAPQGVVIITLGLEGTFSIESAAYDALDQFDLYSRAAALCDRERMAMIGDE
jgi:hypothetical protein